MTIVLTKAQMDKLTPMCRKEIAFENKWRKTHTVILFVKEPGQTEWSRLRTLTGASEKNHNANVREIQRQQQRWQQTEYPAAQFKIVDGGAAQ